MRKSINRKKNHKRTKTIKKQYRGGDNISSDVNQEPSILDLAKNAASGTAAAASNVGSAAISLVTTKAKDVVANAEHMLEEKAKSAIHLLNDPVVEAQADKAIDEAGRLATKLVHATEDPIKESINTTIDTVEVAAKKAGPAFVRAGIDMVEAVPVLGTAILLADEVHQLTKIADAGLNVVSTGFQGASKVASAVSGVINEPATAQINPAAQSPQVTPQIGGMIRQRKSILKRVDRSIREFTKARKVRNMKKNKTKRVRFNV